MQKLVENYNSCREKYLNAPTFGNDFIYICYYDMYIDACSRILDCLNNLSIVHDCDRELGLEEAILKAKLLKFKWFHMDGRAFHKIRRRMLIKQTKKQMLEVDTLIRFIVKAYLEQ